MTLSRIVVVRGEIGHRKPVACSWKPLHDSPHAISSHGFAKLFDVLRGDRSVGLGEGNVKLAAYAVEIMVR